MANVFVRGARWLKGAFSDTRRDPKTGAKQQRLGARGGWVNTAPDKTPHPRPPGKATGYLGSSLTKAKELSGKRSEAIGMGRIGVGEGIGTTRGTQLASWKGGRTSVGEHGIIGFSRIGEGIRGAAVPGKGSSSGSP